MCDNESHLFVTINLLHYGLVFVLLYVMITTTSRVTMSHTLFVTTNLLHYDMVFDIVDMIISTSCVSVTISHTLFEIVVNFSRIMCCVCKRLLDLLVLWYSLLL